jgi:acetyl esterase/lipase
LPLPGHVILFAPFLDLTLSDPQALELEPRDLMQEAEPLRKAGRWWAGTVDPRSPTLSPLYGDFGGLPPIQLYVGTDDVFLPDARTLRDRVVADGGTIRLDETEGGFHVFVGATFTEARRVFQEIGKTLDT